MKHTIILLFLALAAYGQQERIAIINTMDDYDSISVADLTYLTDKLRETAVNVLPADRFGVMTTESIVAFLGSQENAVKVCKESSCLAELGRQVSADYVAQGRIGRFGENLTIKVELYSVKSGNLMGSFAGSSKSIFQLLALIEEKASDLFKKMLLEAKPPKPLEPSPVVVPAIPTVPQPATPADIARIQALIKSDLKGLRKNKEQIQKESAGLSSKDISALYDENKKKYATQLGWLNTFPGFGLGSYLQGDKTWGMIQSGLGVVGWGLIIGGLIRNSKLEDSKAYSSDVYCDSFCEDRRAKAGDEQNEVVKYIITPGFGIILVNTIIGPLLTPSYEKKYNKELKEALNDYSITVSFVPLIVPSNHSKNGPPAVGLAFNVRY